ncbi:MAG: hypothetical protein R3261_09650 [Alphaproteobacteria bacterium]|nr:hypothetical protein [Alphaproteobacteria bacterium]
MAVSISELKSQKERLSIALSRLSDDKDEARQKVIADMHKLDIRINNLKTAAKTKPKQKISALSLFAISLVISAVVGLITYLAASGKI